MFSFIGMPAFVCIALVIGIRLHLIAAVVLWVSWAVPIGVVLPIWYAEDHINSMSATWMISASADICWSPNINLSREKTRSAAAEL